MLVPVVLRNVLICALVPVMVSEVPPPLTLTPLSPALAESVPELTDKVTDICPPLSSASAMASPLPFKLSEDSACTV